jgi:Trypsin
MSLAAHTRRSTERQHRPRLQRVGAVIALVFAAAAAGVLGSSSSAAAIVGGTYPSAATYPFAAKVLAGDGICTGTVIAPDTVLTAAHCVQHDGVADPTGLVYLVDGFGRSIQHVTVHPLWNGDWADGHDLAIITLPAGATDNVPIFQAGAPWNPGLYAGGRPATLAGYGISRPDLVDAGQLRSVATIVAATTTWTTSTTRSTGSITGTRR